MTLVSQMEWIQADNPSSISSWALSRLDKLSFRMILRGTWVFEVEPDIARLKRSFASLLSYYPHLAGRMKPDMVMECNNTGVSFRVGSRPDRKISDLAADHKLADEFAHYPNKGKVKRGEESAMTVTLTHLERGAVLSVCCSHALMDGHSFYTMIANWGRLYRGKSIEPPVLDQSLVPQIYNDSKEEAYQKAKQANLPKLSILKALWNLPSLLRNIRFRRSQPLHFSRETLQQFKQSIFEKSGRNDLSTNDILAAHVSKMCAKLLGHTAQTRCGQMMVLNMRERLLGIPPQFVGNISFFAHGADFFPNESVAEIASRNHDCIAPFLQKPSAPLEEMLRLSITLQHYRAPYFPYNIFAAHGYKPTIFYTNNFCSFPIYDVDFGDDANPVNPVLVIPHNLPDSVLFWPAPPHKGGIEVYLAGSLDRFSQAQSPDSPWWKEFFLK